MGVIDRFLDAMRLNDEDDYELDEGYWDEEDEEEYEEEKPKKSSS